MIKYSLFVVFIWLVHISVFIWLANNVEGMIRAGQYHFIYIATPFLAGIATEYFASEIREFLLLLAKKGK